MGGQGRLLLDNFFFLMVECFFFSSLSFFVFLFLFFFFFDCIAFALVVALRLFLATCGIFRLGMPTLSFNMRDLVP